MGISYHNTPDDTYGIGGEINIRVTPGSDTIALDSGVGDHRASHWIADTVVKMSIAGRDAVFTGPATSGSISHADYRYTVQAGDQSDDLGYLATDSLWWRNPHQNFGTLGSVTGGAPFNCLLPSPGHANSLRGQGAIVVDGIAPLLDSVAARVANGTYGAGRGLSFNATFSEPVFVVQGSEPVLTLDFDGTYRNATYASGNETRWLVFEYTVQTGDDTARLDYNATNALLGSVKDVAGNDVNRTAVAAPGGPGSLGSTSEIATETVQPAVASVSLLGTDRAYRLGETIRINVTFTEPVVVDDMGGTATPTLPLNTAGGVTPGAAEYESGSGTASLEFRYTVGTDHESASLDQGSALSLNGGTIRDDAGNDANLDVSGLAGANRLAASPGLSVDGKIPKVTLVQSPNGTGPHGIGKTLHVRVTFDEAVTVAGAPSIRLETGDADSDADYLSGTGTATLVFGYTVGTDDVSSDLDYESATPFSLGAGVSIRDDAGNDASLDLSGLDPTTETLAGSSAVEVDGKRPAVSSVTSPNGTGPHGIGKTLHVRVTFDEAVTVAGAPSIRLETGDADSDADYLSGTGTATLVFGYTVGTDDVSSDLDYAGNTPFALGAGVSIRDDAGNDASLDLSGLDPTTETLAGSSAVEVDGKRPAVSSVTSPNGTGPHGIDDVLHVRVAFDEDVTVAGAPTIALATGGAADRNASYHTGSGSQTLVFRYAVGQGDLTGRLNYSSSTPFALGSGVSIRDDAGNDASLDLSGLSGAAALASSGLAVDGVRPVVESVTSPNGTGTYYPNHLVHVQVRFNETVTAVGEPFVELDADGTGGPARAVYALGSGSETLTFVYSVLSNNDADPLDYDGAGALMLGDGDAIGDAAGNAANLTLPASGTPGSQVAARGIEIDGNVVSVGSVSSPDADGAYGAGARINVTVAFSEAVRIVDGAPAPYIALNAGDGARAVYASGSPGASLAFAYDVRPGDNADLLAYEGGLANPDSIRAVAGSGAPAQAPLPAPGRPESLSGSSAISIDTAAPAVERVWSPNRTGTYTAGDAIRVVVVFSENVTVDAGAGGAAQPSLALETGETDRAALYASGSGTRALVFAYMVAAGDDSGGRPLDYAGASALSLNGGAIRDAAGNAAGLALPEPGQAGSLAESGVSVDAAPPQVARVASPNATNTYGAGEEIAISVVFTEAVAWPPGGGGAAPSLALDAGGNEPGTAAYRSGNGTATLSFSYTVRIGDRTDDLSYNGTGALSSNGAAMADLAGNPASLALPEPGSPGSLSHSSSITLLGLAGPVAASADASFTGPNTVRIEYDRPLGAPAGHAGPVYGAITLAGGGGERNPLPGGESGLGTSVHTVRFGGAGVGSGQAGTIALNADLVFAAGSAQYNFTDDSIDVAAGDTARTLSPRGASPVVAIEPDGFVRAVNATAAGEGARPAVNVTGLATLPDSGGRVAIIASFAEVSFPPGAAVPSVPGGLLWLYVSDRAPPAPDAVAAAFGASDASGIAVWRLVVEAGGNENGTRIAFEKPVRILLAGQANGSAFYLEGPRDDPRVVPIVDACAADDADAVHGQYGRLGRTGECQIDSGPDKAVYTYHLTPFGAARGPGGGPVLADCGISLEPREIKFGGVHAGMQSAAMPTAVTRAGSMQLSEVSISARPWMDATGSAQVMPAGATSVLPGGAAGGGSWTPINGEVDLHLDGGRADIQFRLDVPSGTAPAVGASQIVTYTASCAEASP